MLIFCKLRNISVKTGATIMRTPTEQAALDILKSLLWELQDFGYKIKTGSTENTVFITYPIGRTTRKEIFWFENGFMFFKTIIKEPKKMGWLHHLFGKPDSYTSEPSKGSGKRPINFEKIQPILWSIVDVFSDFDDASAFAKNIQTVALEKAERKFKNLDAMICRSSNDHRFEYC